MSALFYKVEGRSIASEEWGDYGQILQHGMTAHSPRTDGKLSLERTGPYIPSVTLPGLGDMVLTDVARRELERSGLVGFTFRPLEKKLIVDLAWHMWDLKAEQPAEYPQSGEPEDYILEKPHSPALATEIGELWELVVPFDVVVVRSGAIGNSYRDLCIAQATWDGVDLLRAEQYGGLLFSQRAKDWFHERWECFLLFESFPAV